MKTIDDVTRENWILKTFPEWGTWLNEEIEQFQVPKGNFAMWWLGCTGIWLKTHENTNIVCDMWCGTGKRTHGNGLMREGHQMMRMSGCKKVQPNLRNQPFVIDPFAIKDVDALVVTHTHQDHLDFTTAAVVAKNCPEAKFIGPELVVKQWIEWGVPEDRTVIVKPGDEVRVGDVTIVALESSDRTALVTCEDNNQTLKGKMPQDMDRMACNYIFETSGGNLYHSGDSHYSNLFAKHGNEHKIDVALGSFGENPRGITDKLTACDILRMGEALNCKVMIPIHYDIWTNFQSDPNEILVLWKMKHDRLQYKFHPYIWQVGGGYVYPMNQNQMEYNYDRGFDDVFSTDNDIPFPSLL